MSDSQKEPTPGECNLCDQGVKREIGPTGYAYHVWNPDDSVVPCPNPYRRALTGLQMPMLVKDSKPREPTPEERADMALAEAPRVLNVPEIRAALASLYMNFDEREAVAIAEAERRATEKRDQEWTIALWPDNPENDPGILNPEEGARWLWELTRRATRAAVEECCKLICTTCFYGDCPLDGPRGGDCPAQPIRERFRAELEAKP